MPHPIATKVVAARSARRPPPPPPPPSSLLVASSSSSLLPSSTVAAAQPQAINDSTPRLPSPLPASVDERQYCELSTNLSKKCTAAGTLDGERKKQKISEIKIRIDEAESLKMDLEARALQPNVKVVLLAKLREYKSDLNNLKTEVKRLVSGNLNASARDELLESGMANTLTTTPIELNTSVYPLGNVVEKNLDYSKNNAGVKVEDYTDGIFILTFERQSVKSRVLRGQPCTY
ncbi:hypothetical protein F8388_005608 [Cannabis sativa]|uniref:Vesicle transport v-SNARE N-terminal domain-containing protein n=1 Tax=Cannabis sativa TaxID=3483 RepID=A0A7J6EJQ6_CANSA|nr:hypothetical protein F8388_005608 [Cannabis sativa]